MNDQENLQVEMTTPVNLHKELPNMSLLDKQNPDLMGGGEGMLKEYISTPEGTTPQDKELYIYFNGFLNKQLLLSFFGREEEVIFNNQLEIAKNYYIISKPPGSLTPLDLQRLNQLTNLIMIMFKRSVGGGGSENERKMQQMSIYQHINTQQSNLNQPQKQGFLSKIF